MVTMQAECCTAPQVRRQTKHGASWIHRVAPHDANRRQREAEVELNIVPLALRSVGSSSVPYAPPRQGPTALPTLSTFSITLTPHPHHPPTPQGSSQGSNPISLINATKVVLLHSPAVQPFGPSRPPVCRPGPLLDTASRRRSLLDHLLVPFGPGRSFRGGGMYFRG